MRTGITVHLSLTDRKRLQAIVDDRNSRQMHVWRARIVLAAADGLGTAAIMRTAGVSKTAVWRWQERFMAQGVDGLLRDKTRPRGFPDWPTRSSSASSRSPWANHLARRRIGPAGTPRPFIWTDDPDKIIAAASRSHHVLASIHGKRETISPGGDQSACQAS